MKVLYHTRCHLHNTGILSSTDQNDSWRCTRSDCKNRHTTTTRMAINVLVYLSDTISYTTIMDFLRRLPPEPQIDSLIRMVELTMADLEAASKQELDLSLRNNLPIISYILACNAVRELLE